MRQLAHAAPADPFEDVKIAFGIHGEGVRGEEFFGVEFIHFGFRFGAAAFDSPAIAEGGDGLIVRVDDGD